MTKVKRPKIGKRTVHSDFEFETYKLIKAMLPKGASVGYEDERLKYVIPHDYLPDFIIELRDGRKIYIEAKGYFKYTDRVKMLSVRDSNPDLDIRLLFQRDSPSCLGRGSKTRPSEWAEKNSFKFAIGEIPREWLE